jgi:hypothetical protein
MKIGHLQDLELSVLTYPGHWFLDLDRRTSSDAHPRLLALRSTVQQQRARFDQFPTRTRLGCVCTEKDVDRSHGLFRIAGMTLRRPFDPDSCGTRLPLLARLRLLAHGGIQFTNSHINYDLVRVRELLLALALHVDKGLGPSLVKVEVLLDAVPLFGVELAGRQRIKRGACLDSNIGDDEAFVVERQVAVDGMREHAIAVVQEEYEQEDDEGE